MRTRVKICGITRPEDALSAVQSGADAIGLVFYPSSPRHVDLIKARDIYAALPPFITVVGLFVNAASEEIRSVLEAVPLDLIQFHGNETRQECNGYQRPYIKAVAMKPGINVSEVMTEYPDASGFLLDTYHPELAGGSGSVFEWDQIPSNLARPVILAGGLNPDNVATAIQQVHPYGVDVSSGVESARGIKDAARIAAFIRGVESGDAER